MLLTTLCVGVVLFAWNVPALASGTLLSFQGRLTDATGNLLGGSGTDYYFRFAIFDAPTGGSQLWPSAVPATITLRATQGVFNTLLGDTGVGYETLGLPFDGTAYYLQVQVASVFAGPFETMTPRQRIGQAGFAVNADMVKGGRYFNTLGVGQFGSLATVAYSRFGTGSSTHGLATASQALFSSDVEFDGPAWFDSNASIALNVEVAGFASVSKLFGAGLTNCSSGGSKLLWNSATGMFSCGTDNVGSGGALIATREGFSGAFTDVSSLSFNASHFVLNFGVNEASISLDWGLGGPASLSQDETVTGRWTFASGASITAPFEVIGLASVSQLTVNGQTVVLGNGRGVTSNSLDFDELADTLTLDASTTILTNGFALIFQNASISNGLEVSGAASASQFFGAGLATCSSTQKLQFNNGTFSCVTDYDTDTTNSNIPYLTFGNTASLSLERSLTASLPLQFTDNGANSSYNLSLASGYSIPLTASTSAWESFTDTPSTRILAGTSLSWSGNTLNVTGIHAAATLNQNGHSFVSLSGQQFTLNQIDISADTNLAVSATGLELSGDSIVLAAGYAIPTTASISSWESFSNTAYLPLTGGTLTGSLFGTAASFSGNLEVSGAASSSQFFGAGLATCNGSSSKLLYNALTGLFSCGVDAGASGQSIAVGITNGSFDAASSLSFNNAHFELAFVSPESRVSLDWGLGGPASLSQDETVTGRWTFASGASITAPFEVIGLASVSQLTVNGQTVVLGNGRGVTSNSLDFDELADTLTLDASTTILTNGFALIFQNASISNGLEVSGAASASQFFGAGLATCSSTQKLQFNNGTFSCVTDYDTDTTNSNIPYLTFGNTASLSLERSLTASLPLQFTDNGANSSYNLSLASGYSIPLTASTSAWESFTDTPSTRILAGTSLSWSGNTLNVTGIHAAATLNQNGHSFVSLSGQQFTLNQIDISADTNLAVSATGLELSGDSIVLAAGYAIPTTASISSWESFSNTAYLPLTGGTLTGSLFGTAASFSGNLEVSGAASSSQFFGAGLATCNGSSSKLLYNALTGLFSCGVDAGASGQSIAVGITNGSFDAASSLSFNNAHFELAFVSPESRVSLDWGLGGPASLSQDETVTGDWSFSLDGTENIDLSYLSAPTGNFLQLSNAGQGTTTDGADGVQITFVQGTDGGVDENSAINISLTPGAEAGNIINGILLNGAGISAGTESALRIADLSGAGAGVERAIVIGNGWDANLYLDDGTANIQLPVGGVMTFENSAGTDFFTFDALTATLAGDLTLSGGDLIGAGANAPAIDLGETQAGGISFTPGSTTAGDFTFSVDGDSNIQVNGGSDGSDAMNITAGNLTLTDGDVVVSDGDFDVVLDPGDTASFTQAAATSDVFRIIGTIADTNSADLAELIVADNTATSGVGRGLVVTVGDGTASLNAAIAVNHTDTGQPLVAAFVVTGDSSTTVTTALDVSDAEITNALLAGANDLSGTNWMLTGANGDLELAGFASASQFFGAGLSTCSSNQKLEYASGIFSCVADLDADTNSLLQTREGTGAFGYTGSLSFSASGFTYSLTSGEAFIGIDYVNGPASRSIAQTITGPWTFTAASSQYTNTLEIGTASISNLFINGVAFNPGAYLPLTGGTLTGSLFGTTASFSSGLEVAGNITASASFFGAGLTGCNGTSDKLVWFNGQFGCGSDGGAGGGVGTLEIREFGAVYDSIPATASFRAAHFVLTASGSSDVSIGLDWGLGGPASLSQNETVTGNWLFNGFTQFTAPASFSFPVEFTNTASFSSLTIGGTPFDPTDYLPLTGGTLTGPLFGTHASFSGNFELGGTVSSNLTPTVTNTFSLGTAALQWANVFTQNASVSSTIEIAGTASISNLVINGTPFAASNFLLRTEEGQTPVLQDNTALSFNAAHFALSASGSTETLIGLDWGLGGPASLSQNETVTGNWLFNGASTQFTNIIEASTASVSSLTINGSLFNPNNYLLLTGGTITGNLAVNGSTFMTNASVSSNLEIVGAVTAGGYFGAGLSNCTLSQKLQYNVDGTFSCVTAPNDIFVGLDVREGATILSGISSLSFNPAAFNIAASGSQDVTITLDYVNGPASRALPNVWTALNTFTYASISNTFEVSGAASISSLTVNGVTLNPNNFRPASNSLDWDEIVNAMTLDASTTTNLNGNTFTIGGLQLVGSNASVSSTFETALLKATTIDSDTNLVQITANATTSGNFEVTGAASASSTFGSGLTNCTSTNNFLQWNSATGQFSCGTVGNTFSGLAMHEGAATAVHVSDLTYDASHFNFTNLASAGTLRLDWGLGGPASLSQNETVTGNWLFNGASTQFTNIIEASTASVSSLTINGSLFNPAAYLPLTGGTLTGQLFGTNASFSGSFGVVGNMYASGSFFGAGLTTCSDSNSKLTWQNGMFGCGTDLTGVGGGVGILQIREIPGAFDSYPASLSFAGSQFNLTASGGSDVTVTLDWGVGGPASLSENETVTGTWEFQNGVSVSSFTIGGTTVNPLNFRPASNSLDWDEFANSMTVDVATTINATNGLTFTNASVSGTFETSILKAATITSDTGNIQITGRASISSNLEVAGFASASQFFGAGLATCSATQKLQFSNGTFSCVTDYDTDTTNSNISFITLSNTSSLSLERALTGTTNQIVLLDGGANSTLQIGLATDLQLTNASVSGAFEVAGAASASSTFGSGLADCDVAATSKLLWDVTTGRFSCGTDQAGSAFGGIAVREDSSATFLHITSISFAAPHFNITNTGSQSFVRLDWINGPASRAANETVTGNWEFRTGASFSGLSTFTYASVSGNFELSGTVSSNLTPSITNTYTLGTAALRWANLFAQNASVSNNMEISGTASVSSLIVNGTPFVSSNYLLRTEEGQTPIIEDNVALSFNPGSFNLTASAATETLINLDWTNGPASRSAGQTISGAWEFQSGASFSTLTINETPLSFTGNGRPTKNITLVPEYAGATMSSISGNCTTCVGLMTSDNEITAPYRNFYQWRTTQSASQSYDIWVKVDLPNDFSAFSSISIEGYRSSSNDRVYFALFDTANTQSSSTSGKGSSVATTNGAWTPLTVTNPGGTYTAGQSVTFRIRMEANQNQRVRVGKIRMEYLSSF